MELIPTWRIKQSTSGTLNWVRCVCKCWTLNLESREADDKHVKDCQTYHFGVDWYDEVVTL